MPCNTDYMYPTQREISSLHGIEVELKGVADKMVFATDVVRDIILDSKGKLLKRDEYKRKTVQAYVDSRASLEAEGATVRSSMSGEYAYSNGYGKSTVEAYTRALSEYQYVLDVAVRFLNNEKIYVKEIKNIEAQQVEHRKGDIQRLILVFADKKDFKMIKKLSSVDFTLPLAGQIGFDPDDY